MVLPLSKAPVVVAGLAFAAILVIGTAGFALSQGRVSDLVWDLPAPKIVSMPRSVDEIGPPMPANLADLETAGTPGDAMVADYAPPEIALTLLNRTFDRDPSLAGMPEAVIEVSPPVVADVPAPVGVRVIDLPRRDDPTDDLGRPVVSGAPVENDVQVADLPVAVPGVPASGIVADGVTELLDPAQMVVPFPAPASQRPAAPVRPAEVAIVQPARSVSVDPMLSDEAPGTWPRRLDQVQARQSVETHAAGRVNLGNIFMSDWVEVQNGAGTHIVSK